MLTGGDENFSASNGYPIEKGRNLTTNDIRYATNAAVIGSELAATLFTQGENPSTTPYGLEAKSTEFQASLPRKEPPSVKARTTSS